jgi:subtilisin family serine protease
MAEIERYIVLPRRGIRADTPSALGELLRFPSVFSTLPAARFRLENFGNAEVTVHDTTAENGPKLVDMDAETAARLNQPGSPVRAVKEVFYPLPQPAEGTIDASQGSTAATTQAFTFDVEIVDASSAAPIADATVVAFSDFRKRIGASGITGANGRVRLTLAAPTIERVVATPIPGNGYWSGYRVNTPASGVVQIRVPPFTMPFVDGVRHYYSNTNFVAGIGVTVGVIDTGCGPHADLNIVGARNTVTGEPASATQDGGYHGTHVAGLIGARGNAPNGVRGVAPGAGLRAYRVFGAGAAGASNYAILKAMIFAATDNCDVINLSLGGGPANDIVKEAIEDAWNQGMLVVIAAGNDYRSAVNYPAAYPLATPVSAMGREGTYPPGSSEELQVVKPPNPTVDPHEYIAHFSNFGLQIDFTAPGVGAISTLPNNRIGPLSGTSMAAPVIAGAAACLLSQNRSIYNLPRDAVRTKSIKRLLQNASGLQGFGQDYEGNGLPQSPSV